MIEKRTKQKTLSFQNNTRPFFHNPARSVKRSIQTTETDTTTMIIYALVSVGSTVLAEYTATSGKLKRARKREYMRRVVAA